MIDINTKNSGTTLLEVLITILVLAIGMLGIAALQIKTLNVAQQSYSRTQAVALVEDIADKMRSNYLFIHSSDGGNNIYTSSTNETNGIGWCQSPPARCNSGCSLTQLAQNDIVDSCEALTNTGIPGAKLGVRCVDSNSSDSDTCTPGSTHLIYAAWAPELRKDVDNATTYVEPANSKCRTSIGLPAEETCVVIELVP